MNSALSKCGEELSEHTLADPLRRITQAPKPPPGRLVRGIVDGRVDDGEEARTSVGRRRPSSQRSDSAGRWNVCRPGLLNADESGAAHLRPLSIIEELHDAGNAPQILISRLGHGFDWYAGGWCASGEPLAPESLQDRLDRSPREVDRRALGIRSGELIRPPDAIRREVGGTLARLLKKAGVNQGRHVQRIDGRTVRHASMEELGWTHSASPMPCKRVALTVLSKSASLRLNKKDEELFLFPRDRAHVRIVPAGPSSRLVPMTVRENTIGAVQWEALWCATDGEQLSAIIPAFFLQQHTPYLNGVLASRLEGFFETDDVRFRLDPGDLTVSEHGTRYDPGQIVITGITEPWPDAEALRQTLDEAFKEAGEIEAEQRKSAHDLELHLRRGGAR